MKKSLIFCLFILCSLCRVQGQTEVCLVGTKHNPCTYFNSDSVYAILLRVQPDVVLMELDSTFFDKISASIWRSIPTFCRLMKT